MAVRCGYCQRRIGLFEKTYVLYPYQTVCENCYIKKQEEYVLAKKQQEILEKEKKEKERKEAERKEEERKAKEEAQKREKAEKKARAEAQKREKAKKLARKMEEIARKKEEAARQKEEAEIKKKEIEKQKKEKLEIDSSNLKEDILDNKVIFFKYSELLEKNNTKKDISNMIINILEEVPVQYKFNALEKMTKIGKILEIMKKNGKITIEYERNLRDRYKEKTVFLLQECSESILDIEPMFANNLKNDIVKINDSLEETSKDIKKIQNEYKKASAIPKFELDFYNNKKYKKIIEEYNNKENDKKEMQKELKFKCFLLYYFYAISLLYMIYMKENAKKLQRNKDLYLIYENLSNVKMDREYVTEKIFELYSEFYLKTFDHKLEKREIECIVYILEQEKLYNSIAIENIDSDLKIMNKELSKIKVTKEKIKLIKNFTVSNLLKMIDDTKIDSDIKLKIQVYFMNIINKLNKNLNLIELFEVIGEFVTIFEKINKSIKSARLSKERERLLKGDLSKEKEFKKLELDFNSIKDGFEFEEYVAKLYEKLGYRIEEVTKKSGDQGADVIAYKDDIKYVIQAKFYSSPVGNKAVQEVVASMGMYKANKGIVVTNNTFTQSAIELANANNIELVDGDKIEEYKKQILLTI